MRLFVVSIVCVLLALSFPGIDSKLENKFTKCSDFFFEGKPPVIPGILERSEPRTNNFKVICQKFKNKIRFATLYNTTGKIPVFSAYKYTGTNHFSRPNIPQTHMIEMQLEPSSSDIKRPFVNQARNQDWIKNPGLTPVALFPTNYAADEETARSTYTLTNSVPQNNTFKKKIWNLVETKIKEYMDNNCLDRNSKIVAYVLTGIIPGNKMLNERVNIPSHVWTAFCCYNSTATSYVSKSYKAINTQNSVNITTLDNLEHLQTNLRQEWGGKFQLFNNNSPNNQHRKQVICQTHEMDEIYQNSADMLSTPESRGKHSQREGLSKETSCKRTKVLLIVLSVSGVLAVLGLCVLGVLYLNKRAEFASLNVQHEMVLMQLSEINNTRFRTSEPDRQLIGNYSRIKDRLSSCQNFIRSPYCEACEKGWTEHDGKCYLFSSEEQNWFDSRLSCEASDAHLVIIESAKEHEFLASKTQMKHWIGLNDLETEGRWVWVNNQTLEETRIEFWLKRHSEKSEPDNWKGQDPSGENCAYLGFLVQHTWRDNSCKNMYNFICEKKITFPFMDDN